MFKNLFSKKNMPIIIIVSVAVALSIVMITIGSVRLLKPLGGKFDGTNSGGSSSGLTENSKPLDENFDGTNSGDSSSSGSNGSFDNSTTKPNTLLNPEYYEKVEYVPMPTLDNVTLTESEMLEKYRGYTDWRIYSIRTAKDEIKPAAGCTAYYVSNKGSSKNDGLSPETPFASIGDLGKIKSQLKAGDVIYFERGSIFRGQIYADVAGITYAAYGEGKKPEIYASPGDGAKVGTWEQTKENKNVYKYSLNFGDRDIGTIVFNGGEKHAIKCTIRVEEDGSTTNQTTGKKFSTYADLDENLHFFHDYKDTGYLYLYCKDGNPAEVFDSIEFSIKKYMIDVKADNIRVDNLCFKYGGAHGIGAGTRNGLTVTNCEFGWIGGSIQMVGKAGGIHDVRYGNAIEIYGGCDRYTVTNCYFYQVYDAAVTFQYGTTDEKSNITMKNINISDNVMEKCNYSFEYFLSGGTPETSYIQDVSINNNLMWYSGYGLCEQRPDKKADAHIKNWDDPRNVRGKFEINNNLFAISRNDLVQSNGHSVVGSPSYSGNTYIQFLNASLGRSGNVKTKVIFDNKVRESIKSMLGDTKSKIIFVK